MIVRTFETTNPGRSYRHAGPTNERIPKEVVNTWEMERSIHILCKKSLRRSDVLNIACRATVHSTQCWLSYVVSLGASAALPRHEFCETRNRGSTKPFVRSAGGAASETPGVLVGGEHWGGSSRSASKPIDLSPQAGGNTGTVRGRVRTLSCSCRPASCPCCHLWAVSSITCGRNKSLAGRAWGGVGVRKWVSIRTATVRGESNQTTSFSLILLGAHYFGPSLLWYSIGTAVSRSGKQVCSMTLVGEA